MQICTKDVQDSWNKTTAKEKRVWKKAGKQFMKELKFKEVKPGVYKATPSLFDIKKLFKEDK